MKRIFLGSVLVAGVLSFTPISHAFFVGFGSAGGVEQVIRKGQDEGKIPKVPDTGETTPGPAQHGAEVVWQKMYDSGKHDEAYGIAIDSSGNVYVTGYSGDDTQHYIRIIKYDSSGETVWNKIHYRGRDCSAYGIAVDNPGNICITGYETNGTNRDLIVIKYKSNGDTAWIRTYDSGGEDDGCSGIIIDDTGNVYVAGYSDIGLSRIIKYDSDGDTKWNRTYGDTGGLDIAVDKSGNIYTFGEVGIIPVTDFCLSKYNSNGDTIWVKIYNKAGCDQARGIAVDSFGNVYVHGFSSNGSNDDFHTIKYNSNGDTVWDKMYDTGNYDQGTGITIDSSNNAYVTGYAPPAGGGMGFLTIKYNSNGDTIWVKTFGVTEGAYDIAVDNLGNVYVTGASSANGSNWDFITVKYRQY